MYWLICSFCLLMQPGLKTGSLLVRLGKLLLHSAMVLFLTFTINYLAKVLLFFFCPSFLILSSLFQPFSPFLTPSFSAFLLFSYPLVCFPFTLPLLSISKASFSLYLILSPCLSPPLYFLSFYFPWPLLLTFLLSSYCCFTSIHPPPNCSPAVLSCI